MADVAVVEVIREEHRRVLVLTPTGAVDTARAPSLRARMLPALDGSPRRVVIDLSRVDYMNTAGVATLVEMLELARSRRIELALCGLTDSVRSTLWITRLIDVFTLAESREQALAG